MRSIYLVIAFLLAISLTQAIKLNNLRKSHHGGDKEVKTLVKFSGDLDLMRATLKAVNAYLGSWEELAKKASEAVGTKVTPEEIKTVDASITWGYPTEQIDQFIRETPIEELYGHLGGVAKIHQLVRQKTGMDYKKLAKALGNKLGKSVNEQQAFKAICNLAENSIAENWGSIDPLVADIASWTKEQTIQKIADSF